MSSIREVIASSPPLPSMIVVSSFPTTTFLAFPNGVVSATITSSTVGVTITPSTITENQLVEVCIPANANTTSNITAENTDPIVTETGLNLITEESSVQVIELDVTYTYANGSIGYTTIIIAQE